MEGLRSVVYLDLGKPEEGIPYLSTGTEPLLEEMTVGSQLQSLLWNWHAFTVHSGDEERRYISEAVEGFRECLSAGASETIAAEQRTENARCKRTCV